MDESGYLTKDDGWRVADLLNHNVGAITLPFSCENGTALQLWMARTPVYVGGQEALGSMALGSLMVGGRGIGSYVFEGYTAPKYVEEKLRVPYADAEPLAAFITSILQTWANE